MEPGKIHERARWRAVLLLAGGAAALSLSVAQSPPAEATRFEVASIKPNPGCRKEGARGGGLNGLARGATEAPSTGRLTLRCMTLKELIQMAYVRFADRHFSPFRSVPIEGGPAWVGDDFYEIDAKAEGSHSYGTMYGPMLQTLLEDRFRLRTHRESRQIPVYALTVAKGGPRMPRFKEGSCAPFDLIQFMSRFPPGTAADPPPSGEKYCATEQAMTIEELCKLTLRNLDRPVVDRTGLTGRFEIHLKFAAEDADVADGPSVFTALPQQLGLKLEPAKGSGDFIVIDSVERPSVN